MTAIPPYRPPAYIVGGAVGISSIVSHGGSLYIAATVSTGVSSVCNIYRSNNQGATWAVVDGAHSPSVQSTAVCLGLTSLTLAYTPYNTTGPIQFQDFDLVTQTWGAIYGATGPNEAPEVLLTRSTGDKVLIVNTTPSQAYVYAGGVWGAPIDLTTLFPAGWSTYAYVAACIDATDTIHMFGYTGTPNSFYQQLLPSDALGGFQDLTTVALLSAGGSFGSPVIVGTSIAMGAMDVLGTYAAVLTGTPLAVPVFTLTNCDPVQPIPAQNPTHTLVVTDGVNLWAAFTVDMLVLIAPYTYNWKTQFRLALLTPSGWTGVGVFTEMDYPSSQKPFALTGLAGIVSGHPWLNADYFDSTGSGIPSAYFLAPSGLSVGTPITTNSGGGGGGSAGGRCAPCATSRHASTSSRDRSTS
jgi:hypothetical protein